MSAAMASLAFFLSFSAYSVAFFPAATRLVQQQKRQSVAKTPRIVGDAPFLLLQEPCRIDRKHYFEPLLEEDLLLLELRLWRSQSAICSV